MKIMSSRVTIPKGLNDCCSPIATQATSLPKMVLAVVALPKLKRYFGKSPRFARGEGSIMISGLEKDEVVIPHDIDDPVL